MTVRFRGLIAPTEVPTGDGRMFAAGKMTHRPLPLPLMVRFGSGGHDNATPVGTINKVFDGPGGYWCEGEFLDPLMVPEVPKAIYLLQKKVMGPSVDLDRDFTVESIAHPLRPDKKAGIFKEYNVIGATLVPMPAFHQVHLSVDNDEEKALLASAGVDMDNWVDWHNFDINANSWRYWPIAPRDYKFDADDAVKRIAYWAGIGSKTPSIDRYASTFLWRNGSQTGDTLAQDSFRLPLADIINGQPYLIYHAVYSAAALLSGAHGGIPQIPEQERAGMVRVINDIYASLAAAFQDQNLKSPFLVGVRPEQMSVESPEWALDSSDCGCNNVADSETLNFEGNSPEDGETAMPQTVTVSNGSQTYNVSSTDVTTVANVTITFTPSGLPLDVLKSIQDEKRPYGDDGCHFNEDGMCMKHFNEGMPYGDVLYADPGYQQDNKHRYPIDIPSHIRAAWSYINMKRNAAKYTLEQLNMIKEKIQEAAKKHGIEISDDDNGDEMVELAEQTAKMGALIAGAAPLAPPAAWFQNPGLTGPTRFTIDDNGRVYGHLATWRVCHVGVGNACVLAPHSKTNYGLFHVGTLICDDGTKANVGKVTLGTGHANAQWGVMPSREHYDNTGWAAAVVSVGEDRHGIWVSGALTPSMSIERIAELRAAGLSGDWREVNGNLELIAALAVNSPGFPIYRETNGRAFSLVAVGVVGADDEISGEFSVSADETNDEQVLEAEVVAETDEEQAARAQRFAAITEDHEQAERAKRLARLEAVSTERDKVGAPSARSRFRFDQQYDADLKIVDEE